MAEFSKPVQDWLDEKGVDINNMTLEELKEFRKVVIEAIDRDVLLDLSTKLLGNGAYGASSTPSFFFYNLGLASDITAESRETTRYMEQKFDEFFHGEWWDRTDIHEKFGIKLDPSKKDWYKERSFTCYGDTDSCLGTCKLRLYDEKTESEKTIEEWFNEEANKYGIDTTTAIGHEIVSTNQKLLNWSEDKNIYYGKVRAIVRHKVSKPKWRLRTKSGQEIIVTNDHSMIVFRNGEKLKVKPSEILKTDKILVVE